MIRKRMAESMLNFPDTGVIKSVEVKVKCTAVTYSFTDIALNLPIGNFVCPYGYEQRSVLASQ